MANVTIDGRDYDLRKLSAAAQQQAVNIIAVDEEIRRLQKMIAICQAARTAYSTALQEALPKDQ